MSKDEIFNSIALNVKTIKVPKEPSYSVEDLILMFGSRISKAVYDKIGNTYKGIILSEMLMIIRPWKFWNRDIRKAYKNYQGMVVAPWVMINEPPLIAYNPSVEKYLTKQIIKDRYESINMN